MSLVGFGVKNLRCLTDTGIVPLKPITLLVGKNSSGKSTFLRAFPLLRQSVENARSSPILWEHPDYVDFGNIDLAINDRAAERSVTFEFAGDLPEWEEDGNSGSAICELRMEVAPSQTGPYVRSYDVRLEKEDSRLEFDTEHRVLRFETEIGDALQGRELWLGEVGYFVAPISESARGRLVYQPYIGAALNGHTLRALANARPSGDTWQPDEGLPDERGAKLVDILKSMDARIGHFMYCVSYLGPQRAVGERLYRVRDVAVEEVRPDGENLANFLAKLSPDEMVSLAAFTRRYLGFEPSVRVDKLTVEILIKEANADRPRNIADVGFGYAEVLPLCAVLWSSCVRDVSPKRRGTSLIALEQPELHLHPAHQARLPRMLVGAVLESRKAGREVKLMVETHSDAIVNELGMLIRRKLIDHDDVQILFFDQDPVTRETKVVQTGYEEDGILRENWPFGFLWATPDEADDIPSAAAEE